MGASQHTPSPIWIFRHGTSFVGRPIRFATTVRHHHHDRLVRTSRRLHPNIASPTWDPFGRLANDNNRDVGALRLIAIIAPSSARVPLL